MDICASLALETDIDNRVNTRHQIISQTPMVKIISNHFTVCIVRKISQADHMIISK
jgi:hypothetical protein